MRDYVILNAAKENPYIPLTRNDWKYPLHHRNVTADAKDEQW